MGYKRLSTAGAVVAYVLCLGTRTDLGQAFFFTGNNGLLRP